VPRLAQEGIWGEVVYPSLGMWANIIKDRVLVAEGSKALNDWAMEEIQLVAPNRLIATAMLPLLDVQDAVAETYRAKDKGFYAVYLPTVPPPGQPLYNDGYWEPLWAAIEETGLVLTIHIGTDGETTVFRGPGGAVMNYVETTYGGQRATTQLISGGALDRHPGLKVLIAEGGAAWAPFLGDRMNEGYRQHGMFVRPTLSLPPKDYIYRQVYVSFQHDVTAVPALTGMGYQNVMWGSDYPHLEGTYGHTQKTLHELNRQTTKKTSSKASAADLEPDQRRRRAGSRAGKKPLTVPSLIRVSARLRSNFLPWWPSSAMISAIPMTARAEMSTSRHASARRSIATAKCSR
jgi:predicted TIM-barrel fold metal-dependent hydrolase